MEGAVGYFLDEMPYAPASFFLLLENLIVFGLALAAGELIVRLFRARRASPPPPPLSRIELVYAAITVSLNTAVTVAGLWMYRQGWVRFRSDMGWGALLDVVVLLLAMDVMMFFLHRIVHFEPFYSWFHAMHHRYEHPRPLTLFVLSPQETLAFGGLWLAVITVYSASWLGMSIYLALNVAFGIIGHVGVEMVPERFLGWPAATSTFHADHHMYRTQNFGFYTSIWDRLFGSLRRKLFDGAARTR